MLSMMRWWEPSAETIDVLNNRLWICSYSGGKDSSSLVTWIEWLRRTGKIQVKTPRLVLSDTGVEYPFLNEVSSQLLSGLSSCGWVCDVVHPPIHKRLYNSIFGRGVPPVHPSHKNRMRWCTQATKVQPMQIFSKSIGDQVIQLTGVRWGESKTRDGKLALGGCHAGGECGLPALDDRTYGPIITWTTCQVVDWLQGIKEVKDVIPDLLTITKQLARIYDIKIGPPGFRLIPPKVSTLRFGCIGCPAISKDKVLESHVASNPLWGSLRGLYGLWDELRDRKNRLSKVGTTPKKMGKQIWGPIKMEVRKVTFPKLLEIQEESQVTLVNEQDIEFIQQCWQDKVYPRGWTADNEC